MMVKKFIELRVVVMYQPDNWLEYSKEAFPVVEAMMKQQLETSPKLDDFQTLSGQRVNRWIKEVFPTGKPLVLDIDYDFTYPNTVSPVYKYCSVNVYTAVEAYGGRALFGRQILRCKNSFYIALDHYLWETDEGEIKDITPDFYITKSPKRLTVVDDEETQELFDALTTFYNGRLECIPLRHNIISPCYSTNYEKAYERVKVSLEIGEVR